MATGTPELSASSGMTETARSYLHELQRENARLRERLESIDQERRLLSAELTLLKEQLAQALVGRSERVCP